MNIGKIGAKGEQMTADFLRNKGYSVIKRNYQCRFGEIDIIVENEEYIVFVEVKTREENSLVSPYEAVDNKKIKRIILTAEDYISKTCSEKQPRFDVACVTVKKRDDGSLGFNLKYFENAF